MTALRREDGVALLLALMALLLMTAAGAALMLTSSSETLIAAAFRDNFAARDAAAALMARGLDEIAAAPDWTLLTGGIAQSSWVDGAPSGTRTLADGSTLDLAQAVNLANCQKTTACSAADLSAITTDRPWGANNPRWTPYAYGALRDLLSAAGAIDSPYYVLLLAGAAVAGPGWEALALRAEAFGPRGAHAVVEATAGRYNQPVGEATVKMLSWREVR